MVIRKAREVVRVRHYCATAAEYAYQRCHDYMARNVRHSFKAAGTCTCVRATKRPNSTTRTMRSMFTRTSLLRARSYGLMLRFYAKIIKLRGTYRETFF